MPEYFNSIAFFMSHVKMLMLNSLRTQMCIALCTHTVGVCMRWCVRMCVWVTASDRRASREMAAAATLL